MDPKIKALLGGASVLAFGMGSFSVAQAQQSFPTTAVTGNEIVQNEANPTSGFFTVNQLQTYGRILAGHLSVTGTAATVSACGNTPVISGTDVAGRITFGTGTVSTCTLTFAAAYVNAPYCEVRFETGSPTTSSYVTTTASVAITTGGASGSIVDYICIGQAGG